jgi:transcriptional antiterminator RfaH
VVNTQATREHVVTAHLRRPGYRVFLPSTWRTIRHARKVTTVKSGYLPGRLFVALDLDVDRWRPIGGTAGVLRIFKDTQRPLAAPAGLVETLLQTTGPDGVLNLVDPVTRPGQEVRITRGPFADQLTVVERSSGEDRVRVLLSVPGERAPMAIVRHDLALA